MGVFFSLSCEEEEERAPSSPLLVLLKGRDPEIPRFFFARLLLFVSPPLSGSLSIPRLRHVLACVNCGLASVHSLVSPPFLHARDERPPVEEKEEIFFFFF